jgi:hypothetical protein
MRGIRMMFTAAVSLLVAACGLSDEQIREFAERLATVTRDVRARPALRDTADGCAVDPSFTNPNDQRMRVIVTYRAFDADGHELPGFRVVGVVPGRETMVLRGENSPGLPCADVARIEPRRVELYEVTTAPVGGP